MEIRELWFVTKTINFLIESNGILKSNPPDFVPHSDISEERTSLYSEWLNFVQVCGFKQATLNKKILW